VAIITGAGSTSDAAGGVGIGRAIATLFAREGASVCLADRDAERAQETLSEILNSGGTACIAIGDVTRAADCRRIVAETVAQFGAPTILVNNVGVAGGGGLDTFDEPAWQTMIDVNLKSAILMSHHVLASMRGAGGGAIVNIASIAGLRRYGGLGYGPSKAALIALTGEIALLHGREGIRANCIAPGHILTPFARGLISADARERRRRVGPLGIEGDAWDVAAAALFLASDEARFVTGACLPVDGGVLELGSLAACDLVAG